MNMNKVVKCPTCQTTVVWAKESLFRPFCSKRCSLIDLGEWANESNAIPGQSVPTSEEPLPTSDELENY
jgi:hypothetical protein